MNTFERSIAGMADIPQWFVWRLEWSAGESKFLKTPCGHDGSVYRIDGSKPDNWSDFDTVRDVVARLNTGGVAELRYAMGFWLTADSGYWFLDIDKCLTAENALIPFAQQLADAFPSAFVEWSSSRRGLHVIGTGMAPPHRNKPDAAIARQLTPMQLEFYTRDRGIAFGLDGHANGSTDAAYDPSALVNAYFKPSEKQRRDAASNGGFQGSDDELIARAMKARDSARVTFNGAASFADLWNGVAERNSENDSALAARLAWWTAGDEERIERLMQRSALRRDKWSESRPGGTYLTHTIERACAVVATSYEDPRKASTALAPATKGVRSAADLQRQEFQPIQWAIKDLLPEGVTILSSDPKLGKSWMVYAWCIAIATGRPIWNGRENEQQGDALLLALEDNDRRMRRRLDKLLPTFGNPPIDRLFYACDARRGIDGVADIREFLIAHPETRIVVIDTIAAFRDADPGRKNQYSWDYEVGALLKPLSQEFKCAFVLVAHNRKASVGDAHVNQEVSGTTGLVGGVDNVFVLKRSSGNVTAVLHTDGRDIEKQQELALQLHDGKWQLVGDAKDVNRSQQRSAVLEALARVGGFGTSRDIHDAMGAAEKLGTLRVRLTRMVDAGDLALNGRIYTLAHLEDKFQGITAPAGPGVTALTPSTDIATPF